MSSQTRYTTGIILLAVVCLCMPVRGQTDTVNLFAGEGEHCPLQPAGVAELLVEQGVAEVTLSYEIHGGVDRSGTTRWEDYKCVGVDPISYGTPRFRIRVTDTTGTVLLQKTKTAQRTIYPASCSGDPNPWPQEIVESFTHKIDVSALTATSDATLTLDLSSCVAGGSAGNAGIAVALTTLRLPKAYLDVNNDFDPEDPQTDYAKFVPGAKLNGSSVAHEVMAGGGQVVKIHLMSAPGAGGAYRLEIGEDVSRYPGVAMNYPIGETANMLADLSLADAALGETLSSTVPADPTGHTTAYLFVRDYAARGRLRIHYENESDGVAHRVFNKELPKDVDGNGLPDRGWTAVGTVAVDSSGLTATGDNDAADGATGSEANVSGDGLSNFEEYRGFLVAGGYVRLNPRQKEVFVDLDPELLLAGPVASPLSALQTLTPRILYVEPNEVDGEDVVTRNLLRTQAVVNFNRANVPVAHTRPQRAVRLISQTAFPPAVHLAGPGIDVPIWQVGILGATLSDDILDIDMLNAPGNVATLETPMRTRFSEVYTRTFTNLAVNTTFSYPFHYDASGTLVPRCMFQGEGNCDFWDTANNLIIPSQQPGGWGILYTVPDPLHDPVEHYSLQARNCGSDTPILGGLTTIEMERLKGLIAAHEMGHAMHLAHIGSFPTDCGDIMFDDEAEAPHRRAMSTFVPQPSGFSSRDHEMMRLWQP